MSLNSNKKEYITLKIEEIERRYNEYNEKYYDGVLPICKIRVVTSKNKVPAWYKNYPKCGKIYIARNFFWTEEKLKVTILHEMAHCYVHKILKRNPFFSHSRTFRKVCFNLKKKHGIRINLWNIPIPHMKGKKNHRF